MNPTRVAIVTTGLLGMLLMAAPVQANLLLNPGAELHPPNVFPEWGAGVVPSPVSSGAAPNDLVKSVATHVLPDTSVVTPHEGNYFFSVGEGDSAASGGAGVGDRVFLRQRGDVPVGASALKLTGWFQTGTEDTAGVILSVIDAAQTMSATNMALFDIGTSIGAWTQFSLTMDLTELTFIPAIFRVELRGTYRGDTDSSDLATNVFFDDVSLMAVPEPSTWAIWSLIGCCVGLVAFRKWKFCTSPAA
ncbi:MAG: hypothetical protein MPJ50_19725 [Pirellulales bacterium]|nr:hypothetical protein [Pirellulales bacterium]